MRNSLLANEWKAGQGRADGTGRVSSRQARQVGGIDLLKNVGSLLSSPMDKISQAKDHLVFVDVAVPQVLHLLLNVRCSFQ